MNKRLKGLAAMTAENQDAILDCCVMSFFNWYRPPRSLHLTVDVALDCWWRTKGPLNVVVGDKATVIAHIKADRENDRLGEKAL